MRACVYFMLNLDNEKSRLISNAYLNPRYRTNVSDQKSSHTLSLDPNLNTFLMPFLEDKNDHDPKRNKRRREAKMENEIM